MRRGDFNEKSPDFDSNTGAQSASDGAICRTGKGCDKIMRKYVRFERLMDHPNTQALHSYWNDLRDGRDAPYRSEIDPRRKAAFGSASPAPSFAKCPVRNCAVVPPNP